MKLPDELRRLLSDRHADNDGSPWWERQYLDAVERIEDRTDDPANPYWYSPADTMSAIPQEGIYDEYGGQHTPDELERRAFELLALADLARHGVPQHPAPAPADD